MDKESDEAGKRYGVYEEMLSQPGECKLCGAKVLRLYDNGICLMCKAKRASASSALRKISVKRLFEKKRGKTKENKNGDRE